MRLFIAVELSEELKKSMIGLMHELKKAGVKGQYAPAENLHLTLAFIGETDRLPEILEAVQSVRFKPFKLSLSELGNFGEIVFCGAKGNQGLSELAKEVRAVLDAAGIGYDKKGFLPHITLIRKASGNYRTVQAPKGMMMVKSISVMKSEVKDGKRRYTAVK